MRARSIAPCRSTDANSVLEAPREQTRSLEILPSSHSRAWIEREGAWVRRPGTSGMEKAQDMSTRLSSMQSHAELHGSQQERLFDTRRLSLELAAPLSAEDMTVQPMDDASPTKWHLAHVTWF